MKKLLIVVDYQKDFIDATKEARGIGPVLYSRVRTAVLDRDTDVLFTYDTHYEDYAETLESRFNPVPHCIFQTPGWYYPDEFENLIQKNDIPVFTKNALSSFDLALYIHDTFVNKEVDQPLEIELCGIYTEANILSTAVLIRSVLPNTRIFVNQRLTAGLTPEKKAAALTALNDLHIEITSH